MPPKGDPSFLTERDQVFLVECIKNSKEKLLPNFDTVAQATQMSKKGAANKFRDIMKRFEAAGATPGENGVTAAKPTTKRAKHAVAKKGATVTEMGGEGEENESEEDEPPRKRAVMTKTDGKALPKPKAGTKKGVAKKATVTSEEKLKEDSDDEAGGGGEVQGGQADMEDEEGSV